MKKYHIRRAEYSTHFSTLMDAIQAIDKVLSYRFLFIEPPAPWEVDTRPVKNPSPDDLRELLFDARHAILDALDADRERGS